MAKGHLLHCKKCGEVTLQMPVKGTEHIYQCICDTHNWRDKPKAEEPDKEAGQNEEINE